MNAKLDILQEIADGEIVAERGAPTVPSFTPRRTGSTGLRVASMVLTLAVLWGALFVELWPAAPAAVDEVSAGAPADHRPAALASFWDAYAASRAARDVPSQPAGDAAP